MAVVMVEHLHVSFDHKMILEDINFTVNKQDVLIILGPNGAGKTTLLKTILGLVPYQGTITWHTKNISYLPPQELLFRKELPPLSIADFFALKRAKKKDILSMLHDVGLQESILDKQFVTLSTGQFQRMMIAWALVNNPSVLLFDEPTAGIDVGGEETIYSLLHRFWQEHNLTIILVTHDLQIVWEHATNVLCLNKRMLCHGTPRKVLSTETLEKMYGVGVKGYEHRHD